MTDSWKVNQAMSEVSVPAQDAGLEGEGSSVVEGGRLPRHEVLRRFASFLEAWQEFDEVSYLIQSDLSLFVEGADREQVAEQLMRAIGGTWTRSAPWAVDEGFRVDKCPFGFAGITIYLMEGRS